MAKTPTYRQRKDSPEQAIVTLTDARSGKRRDYWLGAFNSRQSKERYHRLLAAWEANGRELPDPRDDPPSPVPDRADTITIAEIVMRFWHHCKRTYVRDEGVSFKIALRLLRAHYGSEPAATFGPKRLRLLRDAMISGDASTVPPRRPWCTAASIAPAKAEFLPKCGTPILPPATLHIHLREHGVHSSGMGGLCALPGLRHLVDGRCGPARPR